MFLKHYLSQPAEEQTEHLFFHCVQSVFSPDKRVEAKEVVSVETHGHRDVDDLSERGRPRDLVSVTESPTSPVEPEVQQNTKEKGNPTEDSQLDVDFDCDVHMDE